MGSIKDLIKIDFTMETLEEFNVTNVICNFKCVLFDFLKILCLVISDYILAVKSWCMRIYSNFLIN